jgi:(R)-2-hydroxyacyl-CoA dehydratese activating ATPase
LFVAGLDIGSRSIELVVLEHDQIKLTRRTATTYDPISQCDRILEGAVFDKLCATGYGRKLIAGRMEAETITEIRAYALGARRLFPQCRSILDIGGQDTKAIALKDDGSVLKFEMNDRCAAGTGKFLEFMATSLQLSLSDFGPFALEGKPGTTINSMCTVFAETEATSLMARGQRAEDIALALHHSVVKRSLSMLRRVGLKPPLVFGGGVARNPAMIELLSQAVGFDPLIPEEPDYIGALGAALSGAEEE